MSHIKHTFAGFGVALVMLFTVQTVCAAETGESSYVPQFRLQMDANARQALQAEAYSGEAVEFLQPHLHSLDSSNATSSQGNYLQQYDAQLFYPVSTFHGMSLDLGLNIKYLNSANRVTLNGELGGVHNFNQAIPMFYATALFDLPFDGLSASLQGSHWDTAQNRAFDYRAKVQYKWNNGLGMEGGWQHQQYSLDYGRPNSGLEYESKGLFLDLFMDF